MLCLAIQYLAVFVHSVKFIPSKKSNRIFQISIIIYFGKIKNTNQFVEEDTLLVSIDITCSLIITDSQIKNSLHHAFNFVKEKA